MKCTLADHNESNCRLIILAAIVLLFSAQANGQTDTIQTNVPALKDVYANDFHIGCILSYRHIGFPSDSAIAGQSPVVAPNGGYLVKFHMNSMTPGNNMKPENTVDIAGSAAAYTAGTTQAQKDSIDTHPIVRFNGDMIAQLNWALRQGFTVRGHTLVWHNQTPTAFFRSGYLSNGTRLTKDKMIQRMDFYIHEIIRLLHERWPGLLSAIDVVNEAVNDGTGTDRTNSEWYITFGDNSYIMKAFEFARKYTVQFGETQIKLYYNDYNEENPNKADGIVRICAPLFPKYLDGIGMQSHQALNRPAATDWITTYNKFDTICTEMAVTEQYVNMGTTSPTTANLTAQANQYAMLFKLFVERSYFSGRGKIISVTQDGLNDRYATASPIVLETLWDSTDQCKPAFFAAADVGKNYRALDSLISYAGLLHQNEYTSESWSNLSAALASAENAKAQNYSASVSAATAMGQAKDSLKLAIDGLVKIATSVEVAGGDNPRTFVLSQNYPNPFNPTTQIKYWVPEQSYVSLKVYDLLGQEVATLFEGIRQPGNYEAKFDGSRLASGVYFYQLRANSFVETKRFMLLK